MTSRPVHLSLPAHIASAIREHVPRVAADWPGLFAPRSADIAHRFWLLPLAMDFGGFIGIRADGHLQAVSWDPPYDPRDLTSKRLRDSALYIGSQRYAFLRPLLPVKTPDARICPDCQGSGVSPFATAATAPNIVCFCGGLGWLPEDWDD